MLLIAAAVAVGGFFVVKLTVPLDFRTLEIDGNRLNYTMERQKEADLDNLEVAKTYLYAGTDYESSLPDWVTISERKVGQDVEVRVFDPKVQDDSIFQTMNVLRIKTVGDKKLVYSHRYSHKGRGLLGWSSKDAL